MGKETKLCKNCQSEMLKGDNACLQRRRKQGRKFKWIIIGAVALLLIGMGGCGGSGSGEDNASHDSLVKDENLYSVEETTTEEIGSVKYRVLKRWAESSDTSDDGSMVSYWDEKNALIVAQMSDYEYGSFDEEFGEGNREDAKEGWLSGIKSGFRSYTEISTDFDTVSELTAITLSADVETENGDKCKFYQVSFGHDYKLYHFGIMAMDSIDKDYSQEFESLKSSIEATRSSASEKAAEATQGPETKQPTAEDVDNSVPTEYKSALNKAKSYSDIMNMSKAGIYDQLTSEYGEKFSAEAAQYAIDNMEADWNANALAKAETYGKTMSMSKAGIYDQLVSEQGEKFTAEEAQYAIDNVQIDWNANALAKAKSYQETMSMSPEAIRDQLVSEYGEKFTAEEAEYAIQNLN